MYPSTTAKRRVQMGYGCAAGKVSYGYTEDVCVPAGGDRGRRCVEKDAGIGKSEGMGEISCGVVSCRGGRRLSERGISVQNPDGEEKS